ncbi:hypothetical protein PUR47_23950, partial [Klebsiella pneumoniae]|nr:hypothetical protein [Klebsiella pneumoniae]
MLAGHNYDNKAEGVAEVFQQKTARDPLQFDVKNSLRQEGEKEMERDALALLWSAIAAGLSMGASLLA